MAKGWYVILLSPELMREFMCKLKIQKGNFQIMELFMKFSHQWPPRDTVPLPFLFSLPMKEIAVRWAKKWFKCLKVNISHVVNWQHNPILYLFAPKEIIREINGEKIFQFNILFTREIIRKCKKRKTISKSLTQRKIGIVLEYGWIKAVERVKNKLEI